MTIKLSYSPESAIRFPTEMRGHIAYACPARDKCLKLRGAGTLQADTIISNHQSEEEMACMIPLTI